MFIVYWVLFVVLKSGLFKPKIYITRGNLFSAWKYVANEKGFDNNITIILNYKILLSLIWSLIVTWDK